MPQEIDVTKLTAEELDNLLIRAAKHRASLQPGLLHRTPETNRRRCESRLVCRPYRFPHATTQLRHPGFGWGLLSSLFLRMNAHICQVRSAYRHALFVPEEGVANAPLPGSGGGVH